MDTPEVINRNESMAYFGFRGVWGQLFLIFHYARNWILQVLAANSPHPALTKVLQKKRGVKIGKHVYIGSGVVLDGLYAHLITLEDYASVGMGTMIFTHSNPGLSVNLKKNYFPMKVAPTIVKTGAWIAPGCIILAGITIGENSVVGAGSVVVKNVEPWTVVAGNPARVIRKLKESA